MKPRPLVRNLLLSLVSVLFFFGLAETACRFRYGPDRPDPYGIFTYDRDKIFALKKNLTDGTFRDTLCRTNSFGYRDTEIPVAKGKGTVRVLVLGDSVTFGFKVAAEESYPEVLESVLNRRLPQARFDVINTAVPGNSPFQEYQDLRRGMVFDPDVVVIQFVLNDVVEPYKVFKRFGGRPIYPEHRLDAPYFHYWLVEHSALYRFLRDGYLKTVYRALDEKTVITRAQKKAAGLDWCAAAYPPDHEMVREAWQECFRWMQKEADLCRERGIPCVLLATPAVFQLFDDSKTYAQKAVKEFARQNGWTFIDLLPVIRDKVRREIVNKYSLDESVPDKELAARYPQDVAAGWDRYFMDDDHFRPEGHALAAEALYPVIQKLLQKKGRIPPAAARARQSARQSDRQSMNHLDFFVQISYIN